MQRGNYASGKEVNNNHTKPKVAESQDKVEAVETMDGPPTKRFARSRSPRGPRDLRGSLSTRISLALTLQEVRSLRGSQLCKAL